MARLNNSAREILCSMVTEKASEKRSALVSELEKLDESLDKDYKARLAYASRELKVVINQANKAADKILQTHRLWWGRKRYDDGVYTIDNIINAGELVPERSLESYIEPAKEDVARREALKTDIADLDAKVAKAKQEILLRAALGMKYDEVVAIVNSFQF